MGGLVMKERIDQMTSEYTDQPTTALFLEIPTELLEQVKKVAILEEVEYQRIISFYVYQGLMNSKAEVKRLQFADKAKKILEKHNVHENVIDEISNMFLY